jgi:hypothetical protein
LLTYRTFNGLEVRPVPSLETLLVKRGATHYINMYNRINQLGKNAVSDLISTAFEGGSNYWASVVSTQSPTKIDFRSELFASDAEPHRYYDWPLNEGGSVTINADGEGEGELNLQSIEKGLELLAEKFPNRFVAICDEAYDAEDADVFLQLVILNEVVFG